MTRAQSVLLASCREPEFRNYWWQGNYRDSDTGMEEQGRTDCHSRMTVTLWTNTSREWSESGSGSLQSQSDLGRSPPRTTGKAVVLQQSQESPRAQGPEGSWYTAAPMPRGKQREMKLSGISLSISFCCFSWCCFVVAFPSGGRIISEEHCSSTKACSFCLDFSSCLHVLCQEDSLQTIVTHFSPRMQLCEYLRMPACCTTVMKDSNSLRMAAELDGDATLTLYQYAGKTL